MRSPEGLPAGEALEKLAASVKMTKYESGVYESGDRRFEKIVRFATVDCVKAGWLIKNKGIWTITEAGTKAYKETQSAEDFHRKAARLYYKWKLSQKEPAAENEGEDAPEIAGTEKSASITRDQAEEESWKEIEAYLKAMPPYEFQELIADLLGRVDKVPDPQAC